MTKVYLAFYQGRKKVTGIKSALFRFTDWVTRVATKGEFSHVEIAIQSGHSEFECYSSSSRDGGVRRKPMTFDDKNWVLVPIKANPISIQSYFMETKHLKYDLLGAIASTIPFIQLKNRQFCSEWVFNALKLGSKAGWRFSPNDLYEMYRPH